MQNLDVAVALVAAVVVVMFLLVRRPGRPSRLQETTAAALVGVLAALFVLVVVSDAVPDSAEAVLRPLFFLFIAVLLAGGLWLGLARR